MPSSSFLIDAAVKSEQSSSLSVDAVVTWRGFTVDAWLINDTTQQHHRTRDHYGADSDLYVIISKNIGKYVAYTPVHWVLEDMLARLAFLEDYDRTRSSFTIDAYVTTDSIYIDAIVLATVSAAPDQRFTVDAWLNLGGSFTLDAYIQGVFTIDAFIV